MWPPPSDLFEAGDWSWLSIVGAVAGWGVAHNEAAYHELIAPFETSAMRKGMAEMSGCGLVVRGLLRCYGVDSPEIWKPYRIGKAISDIVNVASRFNAWRGKDVLPEVGDIVLVGSSVNPSLWGGGEHVFVVTDLGGGSCTSIDGGQLDKNGKQCVLEREREIRAENQTLRIGTRRVAGLVRMKLVTPTRPQWMPRIQNQ